jgi:hypothetical protein
MHLSILVCMSSFHNYFFTNMHIVGIMQYNDLIHITDKIPGYKKKFQDNSIDLLNFECYCCSHPDGGIKFIGDRVLEYNQALSEVAEEVSGSVIGDMIKPYVGKTKKNIAVVYQPMNPIIATVPPYSLR